MKESVLKSVMRLFAIVSQVHNTGDIETARKVIDRYLNLVIRKDYVRKFLIMFDFYQNSMREREIKTGEKHLSLLSVKAVIICEQINLSLDKKQKIFIIAHILEILSVTKHTEKSDIDFIRTISSALRIDEKLFNDCSAFVSEQIDKIQFKDHLLIVDSSGKIDGYKYVFREFLNGQLLFLYIESLDICLLRHIGKDDQLYFNENPIELNTTYIFIKGSVVKNPLMGSLFYNDIITIFLHERSDDKIIYVAENLSYTFPNSKVAIESFNFSEESGQLIGIMGGSGVGKSTLLNLLNGNIKPTTGRILLNGFDIHTEKIKIEGIIGYVPQDDILIEELTVFQNLYYNARLCFKDLSIDIIINKVKRLIKDLDLAEVSHLKVGNPLNKFISGGQRKRLNIALELIREPNILFVDEPTSGLSSTDSEMVVQLLKLQSFKGKLVIVNIHQPSSDIFKTFDSLLIMDKGGRIIFQGNPLSAIIYLKTYNQLVNAEEGECPSCGNLNPEQILQILEARKIDEFGNYTTERLIKPEEWYQNYIRNHNKETNQASALKLELPITLFKKPSKFTQFKIFSIRNILSKLTDKQYLLINLLEAPVLAFILGWFTKYNKGTESNPLEYVFSGNNNLPVYIFMSVVVALFIGLMVSAEEIIRDRRILSREAFLNLNRKSYFNSKVAYLGMILAIQMFLYILVGNYILEIKGMSAAYWLMLWAVAMVAGLLGLNISASMNSVVSIYILIPILLVPQILLGGAMIKFDKLNSQLTNHKYVPIVGDIMPSRWGYEGIAVFQFSKNKYQKELFEYEQKVSHNAYMLNYYLPEVNSILTDLKQNIVMGKSAYQIKEQINLLFYSLQNLEKYYSVCNFQVNTKNIDDFTISLAVEIEDFLNCCHTIYVRKLDKAIQDRDNRFFELEKMFHGQKNLLELKNNNFNEALSDLVLNKDEPDKIMVYKDLIIQKADPIYHYPTMPLGRSHLFAPSKRLGNMLIDTYWFNLIILFLLQAFFYLALIFEVFPRGLKMIKSIDFESKTKDFRLKTTTILKPLLNK